MAEFAALPLFTDAYMRDCWHLSDAEHGRYLLLLILTWQSPQCRLPNDPEWIARHMRRNAAEYAADIAPLIREFYVSSGNWLVQKRLAKEFEYVQKQTQQRSDAAKSRWNKEKNNAGAYAEHQSRNGFRNAPTPTPTPFKKDARVNGKEGRVIVLEGSPAWLAWKATKKRFSAIDIREEGSPIKRGWYFPSEFPPEARTG